MRRKRVLNRRALLRGAVGGAATAVALPLFEAMLNADATALADGSGLPIRFLSWYWADGFDLQRFEPAEVGASWQLSEELAPLAPVKEYVSVLTGLSNRDPGSIGHHEGMTGFSGYPVVPLGGLNSDAGGPTIDQVVADCVSDYTAVRAVHVQVSKRFSTDGDGGATSIALSHRGVPGNMVAQPPQTNPQLVWETLFGWSAGTGNDDAPRVRVLDAVREDAARLHQKLGTADRQRLDAHLQSVDELEKKILALAPSCTLPRLPEETNTDTLGVEPLSAVNQAMAELIAYAFACDITRVASFLFKRYVSATVFDEIGANNIHHSVSHSAGSELFHQGVVYQIQKLADLLQIFQATPDVGGENLLDATMIYATTDCSTSFTHSTSRQPILIAGKARGYLVHPGIHYQATPWAGNVAAPNSAGNMSDALLTCLRCFDPDAQSVGGGPGLSTSVIGELVA